MHKVTNMNKTTNPTRQCIDDGFASLNYFNSIQHSTVSFFHLDELVW